MRSRELLPLGFGEFVGVVVAYMSYRRLYFVVIGSDASDYHPTVDDFPSY